MPRPVHSLAAASIDALADSAVSANAVAADDTPDNCADGVPPKTPGVTK